jgi:cytochrome c553
VSHISVWTLAGIAAAAGAIGIVVLVAGIVPIEASGGHWRITQWFLEFAMSRSISTHAKGTGVPAVDEPWLVVRGARHYHTGCSPCHGSPEMKYPWIARGMTPHPPYLPPEIAKWSAAELYYIVKHGIKLTGMPAWPAQKRDDEVWAAVAFLRKLPDLDAGQYRALARSEGMDGLEDMGTAAVCARCHGQDGMGGDDRAFPRLAGQHAEYLAATLEAFARGTRHSGIMQPIAAGLSSKAMREIAGYYSGLQASVPSSPAHQTAGMEIGKKLVEEGIASRFIPACRSCHGPTKLPAGPRFPVLAGQAGSYLLSQLQLFKEDRRGGTDHAHIMQPIASRLEAKEMRAAAAYYESLSGKQASRPHE